VPLPGIIRARSKPLVTVPLNSLGRSSALAFRNQDGRSTIAATGSQGRIGR